MEEIHPVVLKEKCYENQEESYICAILFSFEDSSARKITHVVFIEQRIREIKLSVKDLIIDIQPVVSKMNEYEYQEYSWVNAIFAFGDLTGFKCKHQNAKNLYSGISNKTQPIDWDVDGRKTVSGFV